jgi:hypothetical protein
VPTAFGTGFGHNKPANWAGLLAKNFPSKNDSRVPLTQAEFLAQAQKAPYAKAKDLDGFSRSKPRQVRGLRNAVAGGHGLARPDIA